MCASQEVKLGILQQKKDILLFVLKFKSTAAG